MLLKNILLCSAIVVVLCIVCFTHCGLLAPYGDIDLDKYWLRQWLVTLRHQDSIRPIFTNHQGTTVACISEQFYMKWHQLESPFLKSLPHLPGASRLNTHPISAKASILFIIILYWWLKYISKIPHYFVTVFLMYADCDGVLCNGGIISRQANN